jgi:hypothetical protein
MSTEPDEVIVDAEVIPDHEPAGELVVMRGGGSRLPATRDVLMPLDATQIVDGMRAYQQLLPQLLDPSDWQIDDNSRFVKKSGWRKIARAFNLSTELVACEVERDADGNPQRASAIVRVVAPNGQWGDGDGYCSVDERRFERAAGRQKIENDLRATATTRAKNRAISDLVGMGEVSAEEIQPGGAPAGPQHGAPASANQARQARVSLGALIGNPALAKTCYEAIVENCDGELPAAVALALRFTRRARELAIEQRCAQAQDAAAGATVAGDAPEAGETTSEFRKLLDQEILTAKRRPAVNADGETIPF